MLVLFGIAFKLQIGMEEIHYRKNRKQIWLKKRYVAWLIGKRAKLGMKNKLQIYKIIIKLIQPYGQGFPRNN